MRLLTTKGWSSERRDWFSDHFLHNGQPHQIGLSPLQTTLAGSKAEVHGSDFAAMVRQIHERNGVVAAAVSARSSIMSTVRFETIIRHGDRKGERGRAPGLGRLDTPSKDLTRDAWLRQAEMDVCYAGNSYTLWTGDHLTRLRPDWVGLLYTGETPWDAQVRGYAYWHNGDYQSVPEVFSPKAVAHWAPEPLGTRPFVGASWVTSVMREISADGQAIDHTQKFFDNAATANMVIKAAEGVTQEQFEPWVEAFEKSHAGVGNAWRNIYLSAGTDVTVVGSNLADLDLRSTVGGFENRVATRSRVPAIILGIREGLQGSTLNSGNYAATRRAWADGWFEPHVDSFCAAHSMLVGRLPRNAELTYDPTAVLFLQEDSKDAAEIQQKKASAIETLYRAGFEADAAVEAISTGDMGRLVGQHTGQPSVQVTPEEQ